MHSPLRATERPDPMAQQKRKYSRNEKIFYVISLLVVVSMVIGSVAVAFSSGF